MNKNKIKLSKLIELRNTATKMSFIPYYDYEIYSAINVEHKRLNNQILRRKAKTKIKKFK